jgi:uncharacterized membrane protein YgdD (TMEM256/DUF423 family)
MSNKTLQKQLLATGGIVCGLSVALGAIASHALKEKISAEHLAVFQTGVTYQFYHGLGILLMMGMYRRLNTSVVKRVLYIFTTGIVLFSGSLYLLATREITLGDMIKIIGPVTPLGGILFIIGWVYLAFFGYKENNPHISKTRE